MKKYLFVSTVCMMLFVVGCGPQDEDPVDEPTDEGVNAEANSTNAMEDDDLAESENEALTLQVLKQDENEGITIENNEVYQVIQEEIEADPHMGNANDISLYPFDIVEYEDDTSALMFLVINRMDDSIQNLIFTLTFGNDEGEYIIDEHVVDLPEDYLGVLEPNGVVPILVDVEGDHEDLFHSLTEENVYLELEDIGIDYAN